jgi:surface antigen
MKFWRRAAVAFIALIGLTVPAAAQDWGAQRWQCAPFARLASGIQIFGDAGTWWGQAEGRYERGVAPRPGAVLVFKPTARMRVGHVAMVSRVVSERVVTVTHANWSPIEGTRGQVETDVEVVDVSPANDWSEVRVWYAPLQALGTSANPTYGFIYPDAAALQLARAEQPADPIGDLIEASAESVL